MLFLFLDGMCILINDLSSSSRIPDPFFATMSEYGVMTIIIAVPIYPISLFFLQKVEGIKRKVMIVVKALLERIRPESIETVSPNEAIRIEKRANILHLHDALVYEEDDDKYKDDASDFYNVQVSRLYDESYENTKNVADADVIQEIARAHNRAKKRAHQAYLEASFVGGGDTEQVLQRAENIHNNPKLSFNSSSTAHSVCWEEEIFQRGGNHIAMLRFKVGLPADSNQDEILEKLDAALIDRKPLKPRERSVTGSRYESPSHVRNQGPSTQSLLPGMQEVTKSLVPKTPALLHSNTTDQIAASHEDILERRSKSMRLTAAILRSGVGRQETPSHLKGFSHTGSKLRTQRDKELRKEMDNAVETEMNQEAEQSPVALDVLHNG
jgi:hypothetical protein